MVAGRGAQLRRAGVVVLTVLAFALSALVTLELKHEGEDEQEAKSKLASFIIELQVQDGLEYRLLSGRVDAQHVRKGVLASRARADGHLKESGGLGVHPEAVALIRVVTKDYAQKYDNHLELLASGREAEASKVDETQLDPAYDELVSIIRGQAEQAQARARIAQRYGDAGVLLTVSMAMIVVILVRRRRRRTDALIEEERQAEMRHSTLMKEYADAVVTGRADTPRSARPPLDRRLAPRRTAIALRQRGCRHGENPNRPWFGGQSGASSHDR